MSKRSHNSDSDSDEENYFEYKKSKIEETKKFKDKIREVINEVDLFEKLKDKCDSYFNDFLENDLIDLIYDSQNGFVNKCVECGCDMGRENPRQLCGKTFCFGIE